MNEWRAVVVWCGGCCGYVWCGGCCGYAVGIQFCVGVERPKKVDENEDGEQKKGEKNLQGGKETDITRKMDENTQLETAKHVRQKHRKKTTLKKQSELKK